MATTLNPLLIPGSVLQVVNSQLPSSLSLGAPGNFSVAPQITEGVQVMSVTFTPKSASSTIIVEAKVNQGRRGASGVNYVAIFKVGTSQAKCAESMYSNGGEYDTDLYQSFAEAAGSVSTVTFTARIASPSGATVVVSATGWTLPTKQASWMRITEISA
jgi:hypothetical protein